MRKKKDGETSMLSVMVTLILLLIVVVTLIVWYSNTSGKARGVTDSYSGGGNVDAVISACSLQCESNDRFSFCTAVKNVDFDEKVDLGNGEFGDTLLKSCRTLALEYSQYGFKSCPNLC